MNLPLATLRTVATGAITALAVLPLYEPHWTWIPAAIAMAGAIGIHAIPSIGQNSAVTVQHTELKGNDMPDPVPGNVLMGLAPATPDPAPEPAAEVAPEPEVTPEPTPMAFTPEEEAVTPPNPSIAREYLTAAIDALQEVAKFL